VRKRGRFDLLCGWLPVLLMQREGIKDVAQGARPGRCGLTSDLKPRIALVHRRIEGGREMAWVVLVLG
jgi:hypothetical protein